MAGRSTPECSPSSSALAAMTAPVFPAETKASASPSRCSSSPTRIDDRRFERIAAKGLSPMATVSGASTIATRPPGIGCRASACATASGRPTSRSATPSPRSAMASAAPAIGTSGAKSPPIASRATRITQASSTSTRFSPR